MSPYPRYNPTRGTTTCPTLLVHRSPHLLTGISGEFDDDDKHISLSAPSAAGTTRISQPTWARTVLSTCTVRPGLCRWSFVQRSSGTWAILACLVGSVVFGSVRPGASKHAVTLYAFGPVTRYSRKAMVEVPRV